MNARLLVVGLALASTACGLVKVETPSGSPVQVTNASGSPGVGAGGDATASWRRAVRAGESELASLVAWSKDQSASNSFDQHAERALRLRKSTLLAEIAGHCAAKAYDGERTGEELRAADVCPLLAKREAILLGAAKSFADKETARRVDELAKGVAAIRETKKASVTDVVKGRDKDQDRAYVSSFVKKYYDEIDQPIPEAILGRIDTVASEREKTLADLAASSDVKLADAHDAGAERAIKESYQQWQPSMQIVSVRMQDAEWKPVQNDFGIVLRRYKNARVVVRAKSGAYCLAVPASVGQPHAGGGKFASTYGVDQFLEGFPIRCPK